MKKGIVALLVMLALVILISPGIVGRLAEKSVEQQLDWAAEENPEIVIKSERFDRGWFSSQGQHRIELGDTEAAAQLREQLGIAAGEATPALIVDTHIDHGLIPLSSMSHDKGSLAPGLGNAISTISFETANGERTALPATIYSSVGLGGELSSELKLEAGSMGEASWGAANIKATADAGNQHSEFAGAIESFAFSQRGQAMRIANVNFEGNMNMTDYGYATGDLQMSIASMNVTGDGADVVAMGPIEIDATSKQNGDRVDSRMQMAMTMNKLPDVGDLSWSIDASLRGVDAESLGAVVKGMENMPETQDPTQMLAAMETDLMDLFAAGFELQLDQLDLTLPQGTMTTTFDFDIPASDRDSFAWFSVLLSMEANAAIKIPEALFELATMMNPGAGTAVDMGILKKNGDVYEMEAAYKKGLLTVNGAPMPIPLPGLQ